MPDIESPRVHLISLGDLDEAAAFVAALSRFLDSPAGAAYVSVSSAAEVWTCTAGSDEPAQIYVNERALEAANAAFAPVLVAATIAARGLPPDARPLFGTGRSPAWGLADARTHLA